MELSVEMEIHDLMGLQVHLVPHEVPLVFFWTSEA